MCVFGWGGGDSLSLALPGCLPCGDHICTFVAWWLLRFSLLPRARVQEFLWRQLEPSAEGRCVTVLDVAGVKMGSGKSLGMDFLKAMLVMLGEHYPERAKAIFIVNVPWGFGTLWAIVARFIDPVSTHRGARFLSAPRY